MIFTSIFAKVADIKRESKNHFIIAAQVGRDTPQKRPPVVESLWR